MSKKINVEEMLNRKSVKMNNKNIKELVENQTILITGGGGSIGSELCRQIYKYNPKKIIIVDIYENNVYDMVVDLEQNEEKKIIDIVIGSIRDKKRMKYIFKKYKPDIVFHAAAHKHVPLMEDNPIEAIKNNIFGTKNVIDCSAQNHIKKFVLISTDKAVKPTSVMGATKKMCEMITEAKSKTCNTDFIIVRFGNVLESNGSVIPLFKRQIENNMPVTVTSKDVTRYFMTITEAVTLILEAASIGKNGKIFVLDMGKQINIYDLAVEIIKKMGKEPFTETPIKIIGLRDGEKLHEELLNENEKKKISSHDKIYIATPLDITQKEINEKLNILKKLISKEDTSNQEIKQTLFKLI